MMIDVINNEQHQQFEVHAEGELAKLEYRFKHNDVALMHTEVPDKLENKGIGSALVKHALDWVKEEHKKALVYCPFVAAFIKKHPEYNDVIASVDA